ncbi:hypothetical protein CFC21_067024 [Triticum aestivum]|uniref:Protein DETOXIFICATION n=2 Tax=Triticum aestivum TaxID=4565 RepID=A0A9R1H6E3_WHEAT|nr:hypothetical protein CFC21_067024 [Triticum aestivum]
MVRAMGGASEAADSKLQSPLLTPLQPTAGGHGAGKQLESILNDESVPWVHRICAATMVEMRMLVPLAAPAVLVYMINYLMSMSTRIFSDHLGTRARRRFPRQHRHPVLRLRPHGSYLHDHKVLFCFPNKNVLPVLGMGSAVEMLCGQAYGANKLDMLGIYMQRSTVLLMATGVPITVLYVFSRPILILLGESPEIARAAAIYVHGLIPQIFAYAANFPIQKFLQAQSIIAPSAYISAATLVVHLVLSYLVVYQFGLGLLGASFMLSTSWWIIAFSDLPEFLKLSLASAVMLYLETWYFQILVLIAGLLKDPEMVLASLAVCMTISEWVLMIPLGFYAATSVRVSNELGAGNPKSAAFSVVVVTMLSFVLSVIISVVILLCSDYISYIYTDGENVAVAVSKMTPLLALTIILNGIQPVLSGVAVGCGWQAFVAYVNIGYYYAVGIPLGFLLGFYFDLGAVGIWSGMIGGTLMPTVILVWVTLRTDWNKEVADAMKRLQRWEGNTPLLAGQE